MKINTTIDLTDLWDDDYNGNMAQQIKDEIKHSIQRAVQKHVNDAVKDVLADHNKEIKAAAKKYAALVVAGMTKE